ncbi:MAG TPA: AAA family ATPase [Polyangiaceae bacterium]
MLTSITLENFRSFGAKQTVPLSPITVLVGPNNSGKSSFMSVGKFVRQIVETIDVGAELDSPDMKRRVFHRPPEGDPVLGLAWSADKARYSTRVKMDSLLPVTEELVDPAGRTPWGPPAELERLTTVSGQRVIGGTINKLQKLAVAPGLGWPEIEPFGGLRAVWAHARQDPAARLLAPLATSRDVKLALASLRADAPFATKPVLGEDGAGMAAVLSLWRGANPERSEQLDEALRRSLPEIRHALVQPAPEGKKYRLWFQQLDGEQFDAEQISDGVLFFTGLLMHVLDAEPGSVVFIEEPEQSIHPRRLTEVVDLLRHMVQERGCQFVVATHAPALLNEFRDEPEALLLFRRGEHGTQVTPLSDAPKLVEALDKVNPGEMLADGFFNDPI